MDHPHKFIAGALAALFMISMVNCSGMMPTPNGMSVVYHDTLESTDTDTKEQEPCKPLDE